MAYLRTKGFQSKYLEDGLVGLAEHLRGDKARDFIRSLPNHRHRQRRYDPILSEDSCGCNRTPFPNHPHRFLLFIAPCCVEKGVFVVWRHLSRAPLKHPWMPPKCRFRPTFGGMRWKLRTKRFQRSE